MKNSLKIFLTIFLFVFSLQCQAYEGEPAVRSSKNGFRRNVATVMFAGLGGAILGLSTLSFYGNPQDHIGNIWTGLALGIIGGTAYVATQRNKSDYYGNHLPERDPFKEQESLRKNKGEPFVQVPLLAYQWDF